MTTDKFRFMAKLAAWALFAWGALVFIALPGNRYAWMQAMDPSMVVLPDDSSGHRTILALLLLIVIVASQVALAAIAADRRGRTVAITLALVAVALWASRYWR